MTRSLPDTFIFPAPLRQQLEWFLHNPKAIPSPLCFYGQPGTGKTMFARHLAGCVARDICYYDMNEYKANGASSGKLLQEVKGIATSYSIFGDGDLTWERAIVLDEWHNATHKQQDAYKVPFENFGKNNRALFLLCLNTTKEKGLDAVMSAAIRSRCHKVSFDITRTQVAEVTALVKRQFHNLSDARIVSLLPDFRAITREAELQEAMCDPLRNIPSPEHAMNL